LFERGEDETFGKLVESRQFFSDERTRERNLSQSLFEKLKALELVD
jgi:hypothetical protein